MRLTSQGRCLVAAANRSVWVCEYVRVCVKGIVGKYVWECLWVLVVFLCFFMCVYMHLYTAGVMLCHCCFVVHAFYVGPPLFVCVTGVGWQCFWPLWVFGDTGFPVPIVPSKSLTPARMKVNPTTDLFLLKYITPELYLHLHSGTEGGFACHKSELVFHVKTNVKTSKSQMKFHVKIKS